MTAKDIRGSYDLTINKEKFKWKIDGEVSAPKSEITTADSKKLKSKLSIANNWISTIVKPNDTTKTSFTRLIGYIENTQDLSGKAVLFNGSEVKWSAVKTAPFTKAIDSTKAEKNNKVMPITFPNVAYGNVKKPEAETLLFKNATVWTNEKEGI